MEKIGLKYEFGVKEESWVKFINNSNEQLMVTYSNLIKILELEREKINKALEKYKDKKSLLQVEPNFILMKKYEVEFYKRKRISYFCWIKFYENRLKIVDERIKGLENIIAVCGDNNDILYVEESSEEIK